MPDSVELNPRPVKIPGPDHPITIEPNANRIVVTLKGRIIADTRRALTHREASYPPVPYISIEDLDMSLHERTDQTTYCPYKGGWPFAPASYAPSANMRAASAKSIWRSAC
jgi:uncharacterized protein (DUF427 family)